MRKSLLVAAMAAIFFFSPLPVQGGTPQTAMKGAPEAVPILLYHRFGPTVADGMTVTTRVFASHLEYLAGHGYRVIPLRSLVDFLLRKVPNLPEHAVVIVADDAHKSVYTDMLPLVQKYRVPVTLFVYPSAISNASYAMTWDELRALKKTGLFDFQSHTYWHPNFMRERKKLKPAEFEKFANTQLRKPLDKLEKELGTRPDMLAWPFGLCDDDLVRRAKDAGYVAAFTIERKRVTGRDELLRLPRYLMINADQGKRFENILAGKG